MKQLFLLLGCVWALQACSTTHITPYVAAPPIPSYHDDSEGVPFRRVVMLPLFHYGHWGNHYPEIDAAFYSELSKTKLFEVVQVSRSELKTVLGVEQVATVEELSLILMENVLKRWGADAVLFTDITHYFPYQPIAIGVRARLVDARSGATRWGFDHLFDSGSPEVAQAARAFYLNNTQPNLTVVNKGRLVLQSPSKFAAYSAWETYRSLLNKPPLTPEPDFKKKN